MSAAAIQGVVRLPFNLWLCDTMGHREISASTLARRLGVTVATVYNWMRGDEAPSDENLADLSEILAVNCAELHRLASWATSD